MRDRVGGRGDKCRRQGYRRCRVGELECEDAWQALTPQGERFWPLRGWRPGPGVSHSHSLSSRADRMVGECALPRQAPEPGLPSTGKLASGRCSRPGRPIGSGQRWGCREGPALRSPTEGGGALSPPYNSPAASSGFRTPPPSLGGRSPAAGGGRRRMPRSTGRGAGGRDPRPRAPRLSRCSAPSCACAGAVRYANCAGAGPCSAAARRARRRIIRELARGAPPAGSPGYQQRRASEKELGEAPGEEGLYLPRHQLLCI